MCSSGDKYKLYTVEVKQYKDDDGSYKFKISVNDDSKDTTVTLIDISDSSIE